MNKSEIKYTMNNVRASINQDKKSLNEYDGRKSKLNSLLNSMNVSMGSTLKSVPGIILNEDLKTGNYLKNKELQHQTKKSNCMNTIETEIASLNTQISNVSQRINTNQKAIYRLETQLSNVKEV